MSDTYVEQIVDREIPDEPPVEQILDREKPDEPPVEQTVDREKPDELPVNLLKMFEKMQENMRRIGKCVNLSKEVLSECCYKLEEMDSQMAQLESVLKDPTANNKQQFLDASEEIQEKNKLSGSSVQVVDDIVLERSEKSDDVSYSSEANNNENLRKKLKTNPRDDEIYHAGEANDECTPGPSQETTGIAKHKQSQSQEAQTMNEDETTDITIAHFVEEALLNTEGVLSAQELSSFLYLSADVENPVNLAKVSFTNDIEGLYFQLRNFHFLLSVANDAIESERGSSYSDRSLETKVEDLIKMFEAGMMNAESRHHKRFHPFRRSHKWRKRMHHFV